MDASHTCHQNCCIAHIAYEPTNTNHDRKACCELAARLRQEGKPIPEHCETHNPPCLLQVSIWKALDGQCSSPLMQHAALTTQEAYAIQFDVLRRARGIAPKPIDRPRRHRFSSFESQLPCRFPALKVESADLILERPAPTNPAKPQLLCIFCKRLKNLQTVTGLWGHIVHKHDGIDVEGRLREIRRTARLWRTYWDENVDRGKGGTATVKRLEEAEKDDFN